MEFYNLFLDDVRQPTDCFTYTRDPRYNLEEWVIVRDYKSFVDLLELRLQQNQFPKLVAFDHDLAEEHVQDLLSDKNWGKKDSEIELDYDLYVEKTGFHAAHYLIDICIDRSLLLPEFIIHSMNSVGKQNISSLLSNFKKHQKKNV